jgi:hypothetical protein
MSRGSSGTTKCGWCLTGDHEHCQPSLKYYEKIWHCTCEKCHTEVVSSEVPEQDGETNEEVVEEPIQDQETETTGT